MVWVKPARDGRLFQYTWTVNFASQTIATRTRSERTLHTLCRRNSGLSVPSGSILAV